MDNQRDIEFGLRAIDYSEGEYDVFDYEDEFVSQYEAWINDGLNQRRFKNGRTEVNWEF